jgi:hypothetical protein
LPVAAEGAIVAVRVSDFPRTDGLVNDDVSVVREEMVRENVFGGEQGLPVTTTLLKTPDTVGVPLMVVVLPGPGAILRPAGNPVADQVAEEPVVETLALYAMPVVPDGREAVDIPHWACASGASPAAKTAAATRDWSRLNEASQRKVFPSTFPAIVVHIDRCFSDQSQKKATDRPGTPDAENVSLFGNSPR